MAGVDVDTQSLAVSVEDAAGRVLRDVCLDASDVIGRYRIRRLLGQGGMSRVYLARDTTLGRSVALKLVRPERVTAHEAEHFIREAQITAQLNHPHIVQVYDAGVHAGRAYLALEYLDGESLRERTVRGRLSADDVLRTMRAIAAALGHAHESGVHHCDLKPSNVMLPNDGRVRVVDFGLASMGGAAGRRGGTPGWMAPEQWRKEPTTDRVDVWALAVMLHELMYERHPFGITDGSAQLREIVLDPGAAPQLAHGGLPDAIHDLMARSLERDPRARPLVAEWTRRLTDLLVPSVVGLTGLDSPFRGLAAFEEQHAGVFFGREREVDAYLERLRDQPVLPIVGPSGAGKSSFLHAGVIPRLRARERWCVVKLRPGAEPLGALAHQLLHAGTGPEISQQAEARALESELRRTPRLLANRLAAIAAAQRAKVLLACDQLEELFTQCTSEEDRRCFVEMLTTAADDPREPVRVAYTLRDDFIGHMPELRQLFVLRRMDSVDLRRTVIAPIERLGVRFETIEIVDQMLREIVGSQFDLSLLQFACRQLWDSRDVQRNMLLEATYREHGGVARALATHADGVLAELAVEDQRLARQIFGRLVIGTTTRRTIELHALTGDLPPTANAVVERLVAARLLVKRRSPGEPGTFVEIAHESLLATWSQLQSWLEESREERRLTLELEDAAEFWNRRGKRPEQTLAGDELVIARQRIDKLGISVSSRVQDFLAAGERRQQQLRRRRQLQRAAIIGVAAIVTTGSLLLARSFRAQKNAAEAQADALRLAARNKGRVDLVVELFDRAGGQAPIADFPDLSIQLFEAREHGVTHERDVHRPGRPLPVDLVAIARPRTGTFRVEAPGGMVFLKIDGRGRRGESCAPSWLRIEALPGYVDRDRTPQIALSVPSCRASESDMVRIPAGAFIYGGPGEPPTRFPDYVEPEETVVLDDYLIDRTEASNAAIAAFFALATTTGYPVPQYPTEGVLAKSGAPEMPASAIDAYEAEAFCRYMGKRLPSDYEWVKAARGGLVLDGRPNSHPRRLFPWGSDARTRCVNLAGDRDGFPWLAPVDAMRCGASPYGVLHMAGNVAEWISHDGQRGPATPLREIRGGAVNSPPDLEQTTTVFSNTREARHFDFATGVRCVADVVFKEGASWERL